MRRRIGQRTGRAAVAEDDRSCPCHAPTSARVRAREIEERMSSRRTVADRSTPHRPREVDPIVLTAGKGSMCRPFLKVEKDAEKFAACNALAEKIGPLNTPKKAYELIEDAIIDEVNEVFGLITLDLHLRMKS